MSTPQHYWQLVVLDQNGNLVDLPQADVENIRVSKQLNGGSGQATITFRRYFNQVGAIGFSYQYLLYIWNSTQPKPTQPYWAGYQVDPEQVQLNQSGQVVVNCYGDMVLLDDSLFSADINPGVNGNPSLDAASLLSTILTGSDNFNPPSTAPYRFATPSIPAAMFSLAPLKFTHEKLGSVIDTICKTGRDTTGALFLWYVWTTSTGQRQIVVKRDQNPNVISGLTFRHLFANSDFDQYKITTKYRDIFNVVAVYGAQDPTTGNQVFGVYSDATSISQLGRTIENAINVPTLQTTNACQQYAQIYFDLNAFPVAQGSFRLLNPDYTIDVGTWVQLWEAPATGSGGSNASIKQTRVSRVDVTITRDRVEQVCNSDSPAPYLDEAIYRLGGEVATRAIISVPPSPKNLQSLYIRAGGAISGTSANPAKVALTACEAVFPSVGIVYAPALALTQLTDNSFGPRNGQTGSGQYTVSVTSAGTWVVTKGDRPANTSTIQNVLSVFVDAATLTPLTNDIRTLSGQPAFSSTTTPTLKGGTTVTLGAPSQTGTATFEQPFDFTLDPTTWANTDPSLAYLEIGSKAHGTSDAIQTRTKLQPTSDAHYTGNVPGLGVGKAYDLYVRAHDNNDRPTPWLLLGTTSVYTLNVSTMPKMPVGATFTASSITLGTVDSGFKALGTSSIGLGQHVTFQFTINESNAPAMAQWGVAVRTYLRSPHSASGTTTASNYSDPFQAIYLPGGLQNGSVQIGRTQAVTPGNTYDVAIDIVDNQGNSTGLVYLGQVTVPKVQSGSPIGPILGRPHMLPTSTDPTNGIWDSGNNVFDHNNAMSVGVKTALDPNGNLFASDFPGQTTHQTTGTWKGWELITATGLGGAVSVKDVSGASPVGGPMLWTEWTAAAPSGTVGYGPCFYDSAGTGLLMFIAAGGAGNVYATQGAGQTITSVAGIGTNGANNGNPHTFRMGLQYVSGSNPTSVWHIIAYIDGFKVYDGNVTANFNGTKSFAGFRADSGATVYIRDFKFWVGSESFERMHPDVTGSFGYTGTGHLNALATTMFNASVPNVVPFVSNVTLEFVWTGSGPYTLFIFYDGGTAGSDGFIDLADGSQINIGHTTQASPWRTDTGVPSGTKYYGAVSYKAGVGVSVIAQTSPLTLAQAASIFTDGGYVAAMSQGAAPIITTTGGSGGSGGIGGGGGSRRY